MSRGMRVETMFAIRNARGLDSYEKAFLWAVESRGVMFAAWETAAADMGMKKDTFYRTRRRLIDRDLVFALEQGNRMTKYVVNSEAVQALVPHSPSENDSLTENEHSLTENGLSPTENGLSLRAEQKETMKETMKETTKTGSAPSGEEPPVVGSKAYWENSYGRYSWIQIFKPFRDDFYATAGMHEDEGLWLSNKIGLAEVSRLLDEYAEKREARRAEKGMD